MTDPSGSLRAVFDPNVLVSAAISQVGSHQKWAREDIPEFAEIQEAKGGKAKPYQVAQVRNLIKSYRL